MKSLFFLFALYSTTSLAISEPFKPKDGYQKRQVDFWEHVYTNLSSEQTILHDRFEPSIVYQTINHRGASHHKRIKIIRKHIRALRANLKSIGKKNFKRLNRKEKNILGKIPKKFLANFNRRIKGVRYQQGMKEKFKLGVQKSFLYMGHIKSVLKEMNLPLELVNLPHVESSFNYNAFSKVGAAGIWQFMRRSGKYYRLKIGKVVDERLDPIKASKAAARMLKDNYRMLKSWPLAVTAYNHGPTGVRKVIRRSGTRDLSKIVTQFRSSRFSFASRNFFASFMAAIKVANDYEKDLSLEQLESAKLAFNTTFLKKSYRAKDLLKIHGLDKKTFRSFNPHIRNSAFRRNKLVPKGTTIRLPQSKLAAKERKSKKKVSQASKKQTPPIGTSRAKIFNALKA